jgi:hypothetical protein
MDKIRCSNVEFDAMTEKRIPLTRYTDLIQYSDRRYPLLDIHKGEENVTQLWKLSVEKGLCYRNKKGIYMLTPFGHAMMNLLQ